ncbi:hypothetical protein [Novosphingobium pentaromativorans]|uniref:Uncharacterized protein n=1 Tax=Novosphingobium pentaromativorans US6-1 TaxID=1088721 RepID=G6EBM7_9SPHN|nr:hypothetical protein [Novosphingobium pentaromativorans]AIT80327.1 hypothetical protein JI59_11340 [Novosphingobium pentaromativorans US6-1]EHJ61309.1 hypothetical protein NSU_1748 [Novosphingobium pentaromativorans US6-1]
MATAKVNTTGDRQPSRWKRNLVLLVLAVAGTALAFSWNSLGAQARITTAYGARVGCVCRFVSNRELNSCKGDIAAAGLGRTASLMFLSDDAETKSLTARVPLLASSRATYSQERGCQLEPWDD